VIIAHTIKGKGVPFMENQIEWHAGKITDEQLGACKKYLKEQYESKWKI
jgi:transketolase